MRSELLATGVHAPVELADTIIAAGWRSPDMVRRSVQPVLDSASISDIFWLKWGEMR